MAFEIPTTTPAAIHRGADELPFVALGDGSHLQLLQVDFERDLWVVRTRFEPGVTIPTHRHTGDVFAVTFAGSWKYKEYPEVNRAGSYLFEPRGSIHTLTVPAEQEELTDVWFAIYGANENLDEDGNVVSVLNAPFVLEAYRALCAQQGFGEPDVIVTGKPPG